MSTKIKLYDTGDCVEVSTWGGTDKDGFFQNIQVVGLVLEAELFEMDVNEYEKEHGKPHHEWMYRILLPDGHITEAWDYEIKPVNVMGKEYNNISQQALEKKNGSEHTKRT